MLRSWFPSAPKKKKLEMVFDKGIFALHFNPITKKVDRYNFYPSTGHAEVLAKEYNNSYEVKTPSAKWRNVENGNAVEISLQNTTIKGRAGEPDHPYSYFQIAMK